ncbi:MAG: hypothetical protein PVI57_23860 [Gemmatimonadota bacterium]|jgi:hypothetical protein
MKLDSKILIGAVAVAGIALAAVSGLDEGSDDTAASGAVANGVAGATLPEGHPEIPQGMAAPDAEVSLSGDVLEVMAAAGYTYARLDTEEGEVWVAGPLTDLAEGERVGLTGVMDMGAFESPSLDRSFDRLLFANGFVREGEAPDAFGGTVVQAIPASRYVYVEVRTANGSEWLAAPEMELTEGDRIRWTGGAMMRNFASPSLDRTFDEILFVGRLEVVGGS